MKRYLLTAAALAAVFSFDALAAIDEGQKEAFEADCRSYALEDRVPEEELDSYIVQCVQDLVEAQSEDSASESDEGSTQE